MAPKWYRAECLKEIFWDGATHRRGDRITVSEEDVETLRQAAVIGDITRVPDVELAVKAAPENASKNYRRQER